MTNYNEHHAKILYDFLNDIENCFSDQMEIMIFLQDIIDFSEKVQLIVEEQKKANIEKKMASSISVILFFLTLMHKYREEIRDLYKIEYLELHHTIAKHANQQAKDMQN